MVANTVDTILESKETPPASYGYGTRHVSRLVEAGLELRGGIPSATGFLESQMSLEAGITMLPQGTMGITTKFDPQDWNDFQIMSMSGGTISLEGTPGEATISRVPILKWPKENPVLTNQVRDLLQKLWAIVVSRASQLGFPLRETAVSVFRDPEEGEGKAILRVTCKANMVQALAFWDSLEPDLQNWLNKITQHDRQTFLTRISMRVYWL